MKYRTEPLPRIINGRDPITGYQLVTKRKDGYKPNTNIPVCRSGEEHLVENYEAASKDKFIGWVCHHRLELTLDGQFANSMMDLVNKDMYFYRPHFELIWLRRGDHSRLHNSGNLSPSHNRPPHNWKDDVSPMSLYVRGLRWYKAGRISEEEFQKYRDQLQESKRRRYHFRLLRMLLQYSNC